MIGPVAGKTNLSKSLINKYIDKEYDRTVGFNFWTTISTKDKVVINIWDLSSQHKYANTVFPYIDTNIILVFCYITGNYNSFKEMIIKYNFYKNINVLENKPVIIVATQIDNFNIIRPYVFFGERFAKIINSTFILTSSVTKQGIETLLNKCIELNHDFLINPELDTVILKEKTSCCCIF